MSMTCVYVTDYGAVIGVMRAHALKDNRRQLVSIAINIVLAHYT